MSGAESGVTVLVVDDEPDVADAYSLRLETEYDVRTAYGGEAALETMDDQVQVVLLDRRMPDMSGDQVLESIRDRGYECGVIMVTAVDPDFNIIDMPFDDYLQKPVDRDTLFDAIEEQVEILNKEAAVSELFSVTAKAGVLEQRKTTEELESHPEYRELTERARDLRQQINDTENAALVDDLAVDEATVAESTSANGPEADGKPADSGGLIGRLLGLLGI